MYSTLTAPTNPAPAGHRGLGAARPITARRPIGIAVAARLVLEVVLMGAVFVGYRQVRHLTQGDADRALANADRVVGLERRLHVFTEPALQRVALHSDAVIAVVDHYYVYVHFPATIALLTWMFTRHRDAYARVRNWFLTVTLAALAIHVAFPLAPPRMLTEHGFVDTLRVFGPRIYSENTAGSVANQFAAMPSLHFGWAALVALAIISVTRSRWRWVAIVHPVTTLLAIVITANHYWLDAAVAGALILVAVPVLRAVGNARRGPMPEPVALPTPRTGLPARPAPRRDEVDELHAA